MGASAETNGIVIAQEECPEEAGSLVSAVALLNILERVLHSSKSEWLFLRELRVGTGFRNSSSQRLDAFALNCLPHTAMRRVCYEVKISRADFLCELRHPLKRRIGMRFSNEFFFVTPPGLLKTSPRGDRAWGHGTRGDTACFRSRGRQASEQLAEPTSSGSSWSTTTRRSRTCWRSRSSMRRV